jgi:hypothetical protein
MVYSGARGTLIYFKKTEVEILVSDSLEADVNSINRACTCNFDGWKELAQWDESKKPRRYLSILFSLYAIGGPAKWITLCYVGKAHTGHSPANTGRTLPAVTFFSYILLPFLLVSAWSKCQPWASLPLLIVINATGLIECFFYFLSIFSALFENLEVIHFHA